MPQVSIFCDEAGEQDMSDGYYLITLIVHDQSLAIMEAVRGYESRLRLGGLPDVPFHMVDLLHGHEGYNGMYVDARWKLLLRFSTFVKALPISYHTFVYSYYDVGNEKELSARMRRDIVDFLYANLDAFQSFDKVVVYYDEGQQAVTNALHRAFDYMLSNIAVEYRLIRYQDRRLAQAADYLNSVELAAMRYEAGDVSKTYTRFYGTRREFRKNFLNQARRKWM